MRALILANGDHPSFEFLRRLRHEADLFIAADGAANGLATIGLTPDFVLGDFDSLHPSTSAALAPHTVVSAVDQEATDLDKAVAFAADRGATQITIVGWSGGRIDHSLAAASILLKYAEVPHIHLREEYSTMRLVRDMCVIDGAPGDTLSLIVFDRAEGVCLNGVEWPLQDETLLPGSRGVSNRLTSDRATITIRSGWTLVCHLFKP